MRRVEESRRAPFLAFLPLMRTKSNVVSLARAKVAKVSIVMVLVILCRASGTWSAEAFSFGEDPAREWLGKEYAEAIYTGFRAKYSDIPLVIDHRDLELTQEISSSKFSTTKQFLGRFARQSRDLIFAPQSLEGGDSKLVNLVKKSLPDSIANLTHALEFGEPLEAGVDGLDSQLEAFILGHDDGSLQPHEMMIEALRLTNGHVLKAWALAWNVMSHRWDEAATRNYRPLQRKLISLTGERSKWHGGAHYILLPKSEWKTAEVKISTSRHEQITATGEKKFKLIVTKRGDEFSYIYHRIGVELFAMAGAQALRSQNIGWALAKAGALGEYYKYTVTAGLKAESKKRINNDLMAAESGSAFLSLVENQRQSFVLKASSSAADYLVPNQKKFWFRLSVAGRGCLAKFQSKFRHST